MRIRGFLLIEGMVFILVAIMAFFTLHAMHEKMVEKHFDMFNESTYHIHSNVLTTVCTPSYTQKFKDYCEKNNIEILDKGQHFAVVKINGKKYEIKPSSDFTSYEMILIN